MRATFLGNAPAFAAEQRDPHWSAVGTDAIERFPGRILLTKGAAAALWLQLLVDRLAELLPSAPTATIANAGNVPHLTHPAEYAELVGAFLGNRAGEEIAAR